MWMVQQVGRKWEEQGWLDGSSFALAPTPSELKEIKVSVYRCRKCREILCSERHVLPIEAAKGHRLFRGCYRTQHPSSSANDRDAAENEDDPTSTSTSTSSSISSLFVEPLSWMASTVTGGDVRGKLNCPGGGGKCGARLGSYNWSGISDERGGWVTPAFQLHIKAMDIIQPISPQAMGIRQPRTLLTPINPSVRM